MADDQTMDESNLPPLSPSILGIEPFDEFIKEIADFVAHKINNRPDVQAKVEVEAKLGVIRDRSGQRIKLPILVETSQFVVVQSLPNNNPDSRNPTRKYTSLL
ncbi:hypothetical protein AX16_008001 [Volvariella volvacea WC 439]|nr:hypothetical protein AX16_008001 [Volvariella volvacea WC 439]